MVVKKKYTEPPPALFVDKSRRTFMLIHEGSRKNQYITTRDEIIQIVDLDRDRRPIPTTEAAAVKANSQTDYVSELTEYTGPSTGFDCARLWRASFLPKSTAAMAKLCEILGESIPEVSEEVKQRRAAAGKRLREARGPVNGYTLQQLCAKLKVEPQEARKRLRAQKVEKPAQGWVWKDEAEALTVAKILGRTK